MKLIKLLIFVLLMIPEILLSQYFLYKGNNVFHMLDITQKKQVELSSNKNIKHYEVVNDVLITYEIDELGKTALLGNDYVANMIKVYKMDRETNKLLLKKIFNFDNIRYCFVSPDKNKLAFTSNKLLNSQLVSRFFILDLSNLISTEVMLENIIPTKIYGWSDDSNSIIVGTDNCMYFENIITHKTTRTIKINNNTNVLKYLCASDQEFLIYSQDSEIRISKISNIGLIDIFCTNEFIEFVGFSKNYIVMYEYKWNVQNPKSSNMKIILLNLSSKAYYPIYGCTLNYVDMPEIRSMQYGEDCIIVTLPKYYNQIDNKNYEEGIYVYNILKKEFVCLIKTKID